jgi:Zn-dependent M28 family amino/carboxypeptidase
MPPLMLPIAGAPALAGAGALFGWPRLAGLAGLVCAGIIVSFLDIARRPTVPGANDNLTGVTTLLALAESLGERPVQGVRVWLVSTGSEESLMEGMRAFAKRHFPSLPAERTRFICVDCVGSPYLVLAEGEGMLRVRPYDDSLKDLISRCAGSSGIQLLRGLTMRFGTDGYVALRHGYRAAMLMSVDSSGAASNYHWPTDTPDRVNYRTVESAVRLCELVVRNLTRRRAGHREPVSG